MNSLKISEKNNKNKKIEIKKEQQEKQNNMEGGLETDTAGLGSSLHKLREKERQDELEDESKLTKLFEQAKGVVIPKIKHTMDTIKLNLSDVIASQAYVFTPFGYDSDKKTMIERIKEYFNFVDKEKDKERLNANSSNKSQDIKYPKDIFKTTIESMSYFYHTKEKKKWFGNEHYVTNEHLDKVQRIACVTYFDLIKGGEIYNKHDNKTRKLNYREKLQPNDLKDGDSFSINFNTTNGNLVVPVTIKEHLFNRKGIYLNLTNDKSTNKNMSNISDLYKRNSPEYPTPNFIKLLGEKTNLLSKNAIADDVLLIPCFSHDEDLFDKTNKSHMTGNIAEAKKKKELEEMEEVLNTQINMNLVMKGVAETINNNKIEVISNNKTIFKNETNKCGYNTPLFIKNILQLQSSPQWIDELVVKRSFDFFINNNGNIYEDYKMDIVPVIWTTSEKFKYGVGIGVALASYYLLNNTETGINIKNTTQNKLSNAKDKIIETTDKIVDKIPDDLKIKKLYIEKLNPLVKPVKKEDIGGILKKSKDNNKFKNTMKKFKKKNSKKTKKNKSY